MGASRSLFVANDTELVVTNVGARPDDPADGVDISNWRANEEFTPFGAIAFLDGNAACTITSPAGGTEGVEMWGYLLSAWWRIGVLNNGEDISIVGDLQGQAIAMNIIGVFERVAIAGTVSGGHAVTAKLIPLDGFQG